jgi:hypothetical protein
MIVSFAATVRMTHFRAVDQSVMVAGFMVLTSGAGGGGVGAVGAVGAEVAEILGSWDGGWG